MRNRKYIILIIALFLLLAGCAKELKTQKIHWTAISFTGIIDKPDALVGLREDGIVVWKEINDRHWLEKTNTGD